MLFAASKINKSLTKLNWLCLTDTLKSMFYGNFSDLTQGKNVLDILWSAFICLKP